MGACRGDAAAHLTVRLMMARLRPKPKRRNTSKKKLKKRKKEAKKKTVTKSTPKETQATTLSALIAEAGLPEKGIAAAIDNKMIPKAEWESTPLHEGANIVIIKAACGG